MLEGKCSDITMSQTCGKHLEMVGLMTTVRVDCEEAGQKLLETQEVDFQ